MQPLGPNHWGELSTERKAAECRRDDEELGARAEALQVLTRCQIQFLVGGAYAYGAYTSIYRDTKDLDIFLRRKDARLALDVLAKQGWRTERTDEGWIYDFEGGVAKEVCDALGKIGIRCLDGDRYVFEKLLGVAGVKGFGGGFGSATLQAFGEGQWKAFVQEAVNESLKLEASLGQLDTPKKVVILHYSPIAETTEGENPELRPFLGTGRLLSPINRYGANAVLHGHTHHGSLMAKTEKGVPVYNVAMPLLKKHTPDQRFVVIEV